MIYGLKMPSTNGRVMLKKVNLEELLREDQIFKDFSLMLAEKELNAQKMYR